MKDRLPMNLQLFAEEVTGVEVAPVAEVQEVQVQDEPVEQVDETNSGVESSEVAVQNDEKGFANALKAREEQIRTKLEQEYGSKAKDAEKFQSALERTAKLYGFGTTDEYLAALEQAEQDRQIQEQASRLGVDEEVIRNHLQPLNQKLSEYEKQMQELKEAEMIRKVESDLQQLSTQYPDFDKYKVQVLDLAAQRGYSLEDAYKLASYDDRMNNLKLETQRETLKNLQQNADSSTGSLGADSPDVATGYMAMSPAERKAFREQMKSRA